MGKNDKDGRKMETTYLKVKNGIIVIVPAKEKDETQYAKNSTKLVLAPNGLALIYKDYEIPIPRGDVRMLRSKEQNYKHLRSNRKCSPAIIQRYF